MKLTDAPRQKLFLIQNGTFQGMIAYVTWFEGKEVLVAVSPRLGVYTKSSNANIKMLDTAFIAYKQLEILSHEVKIQ